MRDLIILFGFVGVVPVIVLYAHVGPLAWALLSVWNIHRSAWGPLAYNFPYAVAIGGTALVSFVMRPGERRPLYWTAPLILMTLLVIWMNVTTVYALFPRSAMPVYVKVMKILLMTYLTAFLIHSKGRLLALLAVLTWSIGYYSTKGGIFTLSTGGQFSVIGPDGTFIDGNTTMALASLMTIPYLLYWRRYLKNVWYKRGFLVATGLSAISVVGSYSRGAFLAGAAIGFFFWLKSDKKGVVMIVMVLLLPVAVGMMPDKYMDRMNTIETYEEDQSAMGRVNAWWMAYNMAKAHPIVGGGFESFNYTSFARWAPFPLDVHDAHSNYFQILAHHGFVGLILFLAMGLAHWLACVSILRKTKDRADLRWAHDLAAMTQVSLIAYAVGGAFLGFAYYDYYYFQLVLIVNLQRLVDEALQQPEVFEGEVVTAAVVDSGVDKKLTMRPRITANTKQPEGVRFGAEKTPTGRAKQVKELGREKEPSNRPTMRPGGSVRPEIFKS